MLVTSSVAALPVALSQEEGKGAKQAYLTGALETVVGFPQVFETLVIPFGRNFVARPQVA